MAESLLTRLQEFSPTDKTPRLVATIFSAIPGAPEMPPYPALPSVVAALGGGEADVARATAQLDTEELQDLLWMSGIIDTGDRGYAVLTGLSSAMKMFFGSGPKVEALETDVQQRNDAVLKGLALAYMAWKLSPGGLGDRARAFTELPAGRALLTYYAAVEVALPFADNALLGGGTWFADTINKYGPEQMKRLSSMLGGKATDGVMGAVGSLTQPIESALANVRPHVSKIATTAKDYLPGAFNAADKAAGVLAGVADVMPVYRYLGARLAAEGAVYRSRLA